MTRNLVHIGRQVNSMGDGMQALRCAVELSVIICPADVDSRIHLTQLYLHLRVNLREVRGVGRGRG